LSLYLLFQLGGERYALPCRKVERILPMVRLKPLRHAPPYVAGLLNYRQTIIPVVDLCALVTSQPARSRLSSRIILAKYSTASQEFHLLGLLAEEVIDTMPLTDKDILPSGLRLAEAPYLGKVASTGQGLIQFVEVEEFLPASLKDSLFQPPAAVR